MNFSRTLFELSRADYLKFFTGTTFFFTDRNSRKFSRALFFFTDTFFDFFHGWHHDFHGKKKHCARLGAGFSVSQVK